MPTVIHCHTARRWLVQSTAWHHHLFRFIATTVLAIASAACGMGEIDHGATLPDAKPSPVADAVDPGYFPSQFPAPSGEVEPLPPQF